MATHFLGSQEQPLSAAQNCSKPPQKLTIWRAKDRYDQKAMIATEHHRNSLSEEQMIGMIRKPELQQATTATHFLESQGQVSSTGY
jgi:hypothetical protein